MAKKLIPLNIERVFGHLSGNTVVKWCVVVMVALSGLFALLLPRNALGASATIAATVEIRTPLRITCHTELFFGKVYPGQSDGTVVVTADDSRYSTGGTSIRGDEFHPAQFVIAGQPGAFYDINMTAGPATLGDHHDDHECGCNDDGDNHDGDCDHDGDDDGDEDHHLNSDGDSHAISLSTLQVVDLISFSTTVGSQTTTGQIGSNGTDRIFVGGTLLVPPTAQSGLYSCEVELSVNY